ncbi:UNVERIFIED_CONTAM: hypothetical protein RMT77_005790 [Armadillidium vulgare]
MMECEDEESLVDDVIEDIADFEEESQLKDYFAKSAQCDNTNSQNKLLLKKVAILDKKSVQKENLESKFEAPHSFPSTGDIYESGGVSLHSESLSEDQDEKHSLLEEHLLMLHLSLEGSPSQEVTGNVLKAVTGAQTALRSASKPERNLFLSVLGSRDSVLINRLVAFIGISNDPVIVGAVCGLIYDCLAPSCDGNIRQNLIKSLVHNNTTEALFRCFRNLPSSLFCKSDLGLIHGLQVIAKLASKDAKMAVKCRLVGGVKLTHQLIHTHSKNNQLLLPLLIILKFITKNPTNQMVLGKDGCVTTLLNLLNSLPKTHWAKIKLILENLALLTKTTPVSPRLTATINSGGQKLQALLNCFFESNVVRLVRENGIVKLLSLLESWEKTEKRHQVKVLRSLLSVLSHLCDSKHGRKAVIGLKGNEVLHKFIMSCPSDSKFDSILGIALNVFLKCSSKDELPVMSLRGAFIFRTASLETSSQSNFDSRDSTTELDRDSSDDEDEFGEDDDDEDDSKGFDLATSYNPQTTRIEDLIKMAVFFQEYQDFNLDKENEVPKSNSKLKKEEISISEMYLQQSSSTKTFINFVKVAYPDMIMAEGPSALEPLYQKNSRVIREKALRTVDRVLNASTYHEKVVFDLDYLLKSDHSRQLITPMDPPIRSLNNWDEKRVGKKDISVNHLNFESRFESGNLRRAIQIAPYEYDLVLNSDVNSWHHHQWFYFEVSNMEAGVPYIFNIINNEKPNSEFNFGMKPVIFSVKDSLLGRTAWVRTGYDICYHKNHFARIPKNSENSKFRKGTGKSYYTVSMTLKFPHSNDVVYLAYHYPYTFTKLQTFLSSLDSVKLSDKLFYRNQTLCQTLNGNAVPLLTITNTNKKAKDKEVIFLTARVHPGESNSSWVMEGTIKFLLGQTEEARALRDIFIFKIVPMLNPEGVIYGNQRCGLTDEDLNRRWKGPNPSLHPSIYNTKALIEHLTAVVGKRPLIFCDFHGHSRQKNVFMYGCSSQQSWWHPDKDLPEDGKFMILPRLAQLHMATFSLSDCRFDVERARESTARVSVWRQFQVKYSYTMEASTCGCDRGPYKNHHLSPKLLIDSGEGFCRTLYHFSREGHSFQPKSFMNSRLSLLTSSKSVDVEAVKSTAKSKVVEKCEEQDSDSTDLDSEDDLDLDLYGISRRKVDKP